MEKPHKDEILYQNKIGDGKKNIKVEIIHVKDHRSPWSTRKVKNWVKQEFLKWEGGRKIRCTGEVSRPGNNRQSVLQTYLHLDIFTCNLHKTSVLFFRGVYLSLWPKRIIVKSSVHGLKKKRNRNIFKLFF